MTTDRVSVATDGTQGDGASIQPATDDSGRFVAFTSSASDLVAGDTNGVADVFVHDTATGRTELVSTTFDGRPLRFSSAQSPDVSADGRRGAFRSSGWDLVPGDTNGVDDDIFRGRLS